MLSNYSSTVPSEEKLAENYLRESTDKINIMHESERNRAKEGLIRELDRLNKVEESQKKIAGDILSIKTRLRDHTISFAEQKKLTEELQTKEKQLFDAKRTHLSQTERKKTEEELKKIQSTPNPKQIELNNRWEKEILYWRDKKNKKGKQILHSLLFIENMIGLVKIWEMLKDRDDIEQIIDALKVWLMAYDGVPQNNAIVDNVFFIKKFFWEIIYSKIQKQSDIVTSIKKMSIAYIWSMMRYKSALDRTGAIQIIYDNLSVLDNLNIVQTEAFFKLLDTNGILITKEIFTKEHAIFCSSYSQQLTALHLFTTIFKPTEDTENYNMIKTALIEWLFSKEENIDKNILTEINAAYFTLLLSIPDKNNLDATTIASSLENLLNIATWQGNPASGQDNIVNLPKQYIDYASEEYFIKLDSPFKHLGKNQDNFRKRVLEKWSSLDASKKITLTPPIFFADVLNEFVPQPMEVRLMEPSTPATKELDVLCKEILPSNHEDSTTDQPSPSSIVALSSPTAQANEDDSSGIEPLILPHPSRKERKATSNELSSTEEKKMDVASILLSLHQAPSIESPFLTEIKNAKIILPTCSFPPQSYDTSQPQDMKQLQTAINESRKKLREKNKNHILIEIRMLQENATGEMLALLNEVSTILTSDSSLPQKIQEVAEKIGDFSESKSTPTLKKMHQLADQIRALSEKIDFTILMDEQTSSAYSIRVVDLSIIGDGQYTVLADSTIPTGTVLTTYRGENAITEYSKQGQPIIQLTDNQKAYLCSAGDTHFITAYNKGSWAALINHSENPNVEVTTQGEIVAIRDIKAGEPIYLHYGPLYEFDEQPCYLGTRDIGFSLAAYIDTNHTHYAPSVFSFNQESPERDLPHYIPQIFIWISQNTIENLKHELKKCPETVNLIAIACQKLAHTHDYIILPYRGNSAPQKEKHQQHFTPLMFACCVAKSKEIIKILLNAGANVNDLTLQNGHPALVFLLQNPDLSSQEKEELGIELLEKMNNPFFEDASHVSLLRHICNCASLLDDNKAKLITAYFDKAQKLHELYKQSRWNNLAIKEDKSGILTSEEEFKKCRNRLSCYKHKQSTQALNLGVEKYAASQSRNNIKRKNEQKEDKRSSKNRKEEKKHLAAHANFFKNPKDLNDQLVLSNGELTTLSSFPNPP